MTIEGDRGDSAAPDAGSFSRKLDWNLLKAFHEIAESGSISQAAGVLSRKQPTLSLALKRLEERLGSVFAAGGRVGWCSLMRDGSWPSSAPP